MGDLLVGRRKQSILVVDDNAVNAALLKELPSNDESIAVEGM